MDTEQGRSLEELKAIEESLRNEIAQLDAKGDHGEEWNAKNLQYDQIQEELKRFEHSGMGSQDADQAA